MYYFGFECNALDGCDIYGAYIYYLSNFLLIIMLKTFWRCF